MKRSAMLIMLASLTLLSACGGAASSSSSNQATTTSTASPAPVSSGTAASATTTSSTSTSTSTSAASPSTSTTDTTTSTTSGGNGNVRLAATFIIRAGGVLAPPQISAPKHTKIVLTVRGADSRRHKLVVATPDPQQASVAPGRPGRLVLEGVPDGTYAVKVDGSTRGKLIVGANPGP